MLDQALERLPGEIEPVECRVTPLEAGHDPQRLGIVIEAAIGRHQPVELLLPGMPERRVAEIVRQGDRLGQILVEPKRPGDRAGDLRHLETMGEAGAIMIPLVIDEHLRLVLEPAECGGMDDPVAIPLEDRA